MALTVQQAITKIKCIDSAIGWVENYDAKSAKNEHELDASQEMIILLKEYRSVILKAEVDI